jgi:acyl-CoA thioester hydrolase
MSSYRHTITVRYGDCDMQGIVFNAHYLAYADDAVAHWFRAVLPDGSIWMAENVTATFDFMVKKAVVTWSGPAKPYDRVDLDCRVSRWGTTSFDVDVIGSVAGDERVEIVLTYVSVTPGTHTPCPVPAEVRTALAADEP